jgi:L-alanine-DL-glutamate epimerase-like enolase superfamily enzyme
MNPEATIERVRASAYTIPTDLPEADGTAAWEATTLVLAQVAGGGRCGIGYTYTDACAASLINDRLATVLSGRDVMDPPASWRAMQVAVRNFGRAGVAATAISALDTALWDLKAVLLEQPLVQLLGRYREAAPIYGSGGFTTYDARQLTQQLAGWVERDGCRWVKMKVGSRPADDPGRVATARKAIGAAGLFVDANGAYGRRQACALGARFADEQQVSWFEEPVSSDDLPGLRYVRGHTPAPLEIAAGEYAYTLDEVRGLLQAQAIDVQQLDATRCGGVTGFLQAAMLCEAFHVDLSAHCAPALHCSLACAVPRLRHIEWFHDHVRIEQTLFDGAPVPRDGLIRPDRSRPGLGLTFKAADAARFTAGARAAAPARTSTTR